MPGNARKIIIKEGDIFGFLKAIKFIKINKKGGPVWEFECLKCKIKKKEIEIYSVVSGNTKSCGCLQKEKASKSGKRTIAKNAKIGNEKRIKDYTGKRFGKLTFVEKTQKRRRSSVVWVLLCECGDYCEKSQNEILWGKVKSCGKCKLTESFGERKIREFLEKNNIKFEKEKRFSDCKNKKCLPFDFYLPNYSICIEYQGEQHYDNKCNRRWYDKKLNNTVENDEIKKDYCKNKNIFLLEIPYWDYNKIETILEKILYGEQNAIYN